MSPRSVLQRVGILGVLAVIAGLLVAGLALPVVAGVGLVASKSNSALDKLPSYLELPPLAQTSVLYGNDGKTVLATVSGTEDRVPVTSLQIPDVMKKAIVAIEDNRFYEHQGVDLRGVLRAVKADSSSGDYSQGASTITQQYVKLVELEQAGSDKQAQEAATEKSISRKVNDARLAIALEKRMSKDQILTNYLNIAYFGEGVYGVGTAAEHYFQVPIQNVTLAQAAMLAGLVNNPTGFDPVLHPQASSDRTTAVFDAIERYGFLPTATVEAARKVKIVVHPTTKTVDACASSPAPNYCAYAVQQLENDPKVGSDKLLTGGLRIVTGWDPRIQNDAQTVLSAHVANSQRQALVSVIEQPGTGVISAIAQNRGYGTGPGQTKLVYANIASNDVGSTFKAMTLTAAVEQGIPLTTSIYSPSCFNDPSFDTMNTNSTSCPHGFQNAGDSEAGTFNLYTGTWASVNTFYVQLEQRVGGASAVAAMAKRLGVVGSSGFQAGHYGLALTLGSGQGFSAVDMANAYATLDAHGVECTPTAITRVTDPTGKAIAFTHAPCHQAVSADVADTVTSVLQGVLDKPGATGAGLGIDRPAAGKTGTLDDGIGGWFVGYIPQYVSAVGLFDPRGPSYPAAPICDGVTGNCFTTSNLFGASVSGPAWQGIMERVAEPLDVQDFALPEAVNRGAPPQTTPTTGPTTPIPNVTGQTESAAGAALEAAGFVARYQAAEVDSSLPQGTVVSTSPSGSAPAGSTVVMILSNGRAPGAPTTVTVTPTNTAPTSPATSPTKKRKK